MSNYVLKIITDLTKFQNRVDEINGATSYDAVKHTVADLKRTLIARRKINPNKK